jgi:hypothetical protein
VNPSLSHPSPLLTKKWCFWSGSLIHHMTGCLDFLYSSSAELLFTPLRYTSHKTSETTTSFLFSTLRASPVVLSMWHCEIIFHIQVLVMYPFATPPIKLKLGKQILGGLLITNHLDQSLWWSNQKHWAAVRSYLLHNFFAGAERCWAFYQPRQLRNYAEPKLFSWVKPAYVRFSSSIFTVQDHILSTARDALRLFWRLMHELVLLGATGDTKYHSIFNHIMGTQKIREYAPGLLL